jgi:3-phenylpropionate/trans-cinnamate dioxygenase ferredoxin reductase subunit
MTWPLPMPPPDTIDVLLTGGGVAAARCARSLRRSGFTGSIALVGEEPLSPYNRPPLSKELLLLDEPPTDELLLAESPDWYGRRGIQLRTGTAIVAIEPDARLARLSDGTAVRYERCLLATGAAPRRLRIPGGERALMLRTLADARAMRAAIDGRPGASVVVVGGGFIGLELASAFAARGMRVTVVEMGDRLWAGQLGLLLEARARGLLENAGVTIRTGATVDRIDDRGAWVGSELLAADWVAAGIGVAPRDELAVAAGLAVDDGILVDGGGRTSDAGIWAAGDVARVDGRRVEHWHAAREAGERAAMSMLGGPPGHVPVPWVFSELAGLPLDVIGDPSGADDEAWLLEDRIVGSFREGRVTGLAILAGAMEVGVARRLVGDGAREGEVLAAAG